MKSSLLILTALVVTAFSAIAEEVGPVMVRVEVQMVSMPMEKGLPLLPKLRDAATIDGTFNQIQEMLASGEATLLGWPEVLTKSGQRAVTEDIQEIRYATEFDQHPTPQASTDKTAATPPETSAQEHGGAPVPTAFETRNAGPTLEVEPVIGPDGRTIDLNIVPQYVRLLETTTVASGRDAHGHDWKIGQPKFYTAKTTTSVTLVAGQRLLLASFRGPEGSDQIQFFLLKAELVVAADAKAK